MTWFLQFLSAALAVPSIRQFAQQCALLFFAEVFFGKNADPKFREDFMANAQKLGQATSSAEKKAMLQALQGSGGRQ
jgi:hypothetical protein